jgi:hypothetical protein
LANKYFDISLWTGTGSSITVTNSGGFQPDWIWSKSRSNAGTNNTLTDVLRNFNWLASDSTSSESGLGQPGPITAYNSNGFTGDAGISGSGRTYVGWQWKAGGTGVTNTSGSITSTVSVNTTSGFSVVTYTAVGGVSTVGHGLGVVPSMMIFKDRDGTANWPVYHISLGNTSACLLDTTAASSATANWWNNTSPTSSVVTIGSNENTSTRKYFAYCFAPIAGYSAFGSYTGNGSADGPFVFTGMRPAYILIKRSSSSGTYWNIYDTTRSSFNLTDDVLYANLSDAEAANESSLGLDILSNGFKIRTTGSSINASSETYIYMAFASNPFKYSLAR